MQPRTTIEVTSHGRHYVSSTPVMSGCWSAGTWLAGVRVHEVLQACVCCAFLTRFGRIGQTLIPCGIVCGAVQRHREELPPRLRSGTMERRYQGSAATVAYTVAYTVVYQMFLYWQTQWHAQGQKNT